MVQTCTFSSVCFKDSLFQRYSVVGRLEKRGKGQRKRGNKSVKTHLISLQGLHNSQQPLLQKLQETGLIQARRVVNANSLSRSRELVPPACCVPDHDT